MKVILDMMRQDELIKGAHEGGEQNQLSQAKAGHWGRDKMLHMLTERYTFPMMKMRVERFITFCDKCQRGNYRSFKAAKTLHPVKVPNKVWAKVGIDLIGKLALSGGYQYICTAVDYFTKWVEAEPLKTKQSWEVAAFLHKLQCRYGIAEIHITDQGKEFNSELMKEYYKLSGIEHKVTAAYHPMANGLVERQNRTIEDCIRKVMSQKADWLPLLDSVLFACRVSKHSSTGFTPYFMLYQRHPILPFQYTDAILHGESVAAEEQGEVMDFDEAVNSMSEQREQVFAKATSNIRKAQDHYSRNYNERNAGEPLFIGDKVLKLNVKRIGRKEKFLPKWIGPYVIVNVTKTGSYVLKDKYAKEMKKPIPPQQVKKYFEGWQSVSMEEDLEGTFLRRQAIDVHCIVLLQIL